MSSVRRHCRNRNIVNVDNRLYSPFYDWEGDDGLAWYEFADRNAMCLFTMCDHDSYNAWAKATDEYIQGRLLPFYEDVLGRAKSKYSGAPMPLPLTDKFNQVKKIIDEWNASGIEPDKTLGDDFAHPVNSWWVGKIKEIIKYFDEAACMFDKLNDIAATDLESPELAQGVPEHTITPSPTGSYFDGSGGPSKGDSKSSTTSILGAVALGGAAYFGFKVLTE